MATVVTFTPPPPVEEELTLTFTGDEAKNLIHLLHWHVAALVVKDYLGFTYGLYNVISKVEPKSNKDKYTGVVGMKD